MQHVDRALRRSFALSAGFHLLIFGAALAFAHYGEFLYSGGARIISVDLVAEPGQGGGRSLVRTGGEAPLDDAGPRPSVGVPDPVAPAAPDPEPIRGGGAQGNAAAAPGEGAAAGKASAGPAGSDGALSAEQWRMLQTAIEKAKSYPRLARERGIEGVVLLRFRVLPSGAAEQVNVVTSSGADILDEASVRTVRAAGPLPYVDGWIEVPMVYRLQ